MDTLLSIISASFLTSILNALYFSYQIGSWKATIETQIKNLETDIADVRNRIERIESKLMEV